MSNALYSGVVVICTIVLTPPSKVPHILNPRPTAAAVGFINTEFTISMTVETEAQAIAILDATS